MSQSSLICGLTLLELIKLKLSVLCVKDVTTSIYRIGMGR